MGKVISEVEVLKLRESSGDEKSACDAVWDIWEGVRGFCLEKCES